jgi:hypothetical protein
VQVWAIMRRLTHAAGRLLLRETMVAIACRSAAAPARTVQQTRSLAGAPCNRERVDALLTTDCLDGYDARMLLATVVLHSLLRWVVLVFGVIAVSKAIAGTGGRRPWTSFDQRAGRSFVMALDLQMLVGLVLYGLLSPITRAAFGDMSAAMRDPVLRFFAIEHLTIMVGAIAFVHIGSARARKAPTDAAKHKAAAIFFTIGLLLILLGTPWPFRAVGRPLLPHF